MIPYFLVLASSALLSAFSQLASRARRSLQSSPARFEKQVLTTADVSEASARRWTVFDFVCLGLLVAFSGLRYGIGTDYMAYDSLFRSLATHDWSGSIAASPMEPGYTILSLAVKGSFEDSRAMFWLASLITVGLVFVGMKRSSRAFTMSLFLYFTLAFYLAPFNATRQGIAVSIVFFADHYYSRNRFFFYLLMAIAVSIHVSTIFVVILYVVARHVRPSLMLLVGVLVAGIALATTSLIESGLSGVLEALNGRYDNYLQDSPTGVGTYLMILAKLVLICYMLWIGRENDQDQHHRTMVIFSLVFLVAGTASMVLVRMEMFFGIFVVLAIPNLLTGRKGSGVHRFILVTAGLIYMTFYLLNYGGLVPYETYL